MPMQSHLDPVKLKKHRLWGVGQQWGPGLRTLWAWERILTPPDQLNVVLHENGADELCRAVRNEGGEAPTSIHCPINSPHNYAALRRLMSPPSLLQTTSWAEGNANAPNRNYLSGFWFFCWPLRGDHIKELVRKKYSGCWVLCGPAWGLLESPRGDLVPRSTRETLLKPHMRSQTFRMRVRDEFVSKHISTANDTGYICWKIWGQCISANLSFVWRKRLFRW